MSTRARTLHATLADTLPHEDGHGGLWEVRCVFVDCGWSQGGEYRFSQNEADALALAHVYGTTHEHRMNKTHSAKRGRTS